MIYDIATLYSWHQSYYISPLTDYIWKHIHCISVITPRLWIIQCHCTYGNTATICMTSYELHVTSRPLYLCHHTHPIEDITATIWMVSQPVYLWNHIPCIYDIISSKYDNLCTADDIAYTLSHQTTVFIMSHPLQAWHHTPCIRYCAHCIFVITTSPLISHPLFNDITPRDVLWHHIQGIHDIRSSLYDIISTL